MAFGARIAVLHRDWMDGTLAFSVLHFHPG